MDVEVTPLKTRLVAGPVGVPGATVICEPASADVDAPTALMALMLKL
jgi:hypothetical protein